MRSAVGQVPDEVVLPQLSDFTEAVLRQQVLPRARDIDAFTAFDVLNGGWAAKLWPEIITTAYPELNGKRLKELLMALTLKTIYNRVCGKAKLDFSENFAGKAMITCHLLKKGLLGKRFDIVYSHGKDQNEDSYNACTAKGSR